jgi:hypothetical protein
VGNFSNRADLVDASFDCLRGGRLINLDIRGCSRLTNAALAIFPGLLNLSVSNFPSVTDAAFAGLAQLEYLDVSWLYGPTSRHFSRVTGEVRRPASFRRAVPKNSPKFPAQTFSNMGLTDAAFARLPRLRKLNLSGVRQPSISLYALTLLKAGSPLLSHLDVRNCNDDFVSEARRLWPAAGVVVHDVAED